MTTNMRKCPDCDGDVSTNVSRCPHCGRVENPFHIPDGALLIGLVIIGVLVFLILSYPWVL